MLTRLRLVYVTAVPCSRKLSSACRLRSSAPLIASACRVDALARMFATHEYVPYPQARLRALRFRVTLTGLTHPAQVVIITRQDWHGFLRRTLPDDHPIQQPPPAAPNVYLLTNAPTPPRITSSAGTGAGGPLNACSAYRGEYIMEDHARSSVSGKKKIVMRCGRISLPRSGFVQRHA